MTNKEILKKQIIYRSTHRGSKEMDLLLGNFVKRYIDSFNEEELKELNKIICLEDEVIHKWYFENKQNELMVNNKVSRYLKDFSP